MNKNLEKRLESVINSNGKGFWFYIIPLSLATLFLAGTAAYFSVYGLSKVFAGAELAAIIMASAIEFGKIVAVSFTNRFWSVLGKLKGYLLTAIIVAMVVTSASIFGFLSDAYQRTANELSVVNKKIEIDNTKKNFLTKQIDEYEKQAELKRKRIDQLNTLRSNQEIRLDSLYAKNWYNSARRTESQISDANNEIINLTSDLSNISNRISALNDSIGSIDFRILEYSSTDASAELGPIIFVKDLFNTEMDRVVVIFIFMLIFVFDPMAMSLVIAINKLLIMRQNKYPNDKQSIHDFIENDAGMSIDERFEKINKKTEAKKSGLIVDSQIKDIDENNRHRKN